MKATAWFGVATLVIVGGLGALLAIPFAAAAERRAIATSAVIAVVVQLFAFAIMRLTPVSKFVGALVIGVALRFVVLVAYALVGVRLVGLPATAALISLVVFLFASSLIEPKLLTK